MGTPVWSRREMRGPKSGNFRRQLHNAVARACERRAFGNPRKGTARIGHRAGREGRDQSRGSQRMEGAAVLRPVDEIAEVFTDDAAHWGIAAIANLALIGEPGQIGKRSEPAIALFPKGHSMHWDMSKLIWTFRRMGGPA